MSLKSLKTRSLLELIALFERCSSVVAGSTGQRLRGVPGWYLARQSALSASDLAAWTERIGYAGSYPTQCDDEHIPVEIQEDEDPDRYRYRSPKTFRTKYVAADLVAVYAVPAVKLLTLLADLLGIAQAHRRGITMPAIDGVLWNLGKMRIGNVQIDVWLARGLASCIEQVFAHFQEASLPDQGLIFTTCQSLPGIVQPPRRYRIIPIVEVLVDYTVTPHIDADLIHRLLLAPAGSKEEKSLPFRFDPFTNTLTIATKSDKPWSIKGPKQVAVVKYLVEQFMNGRIRVSAGDILVAAHGSRDAAKGKRVASIFSGNSVWEEYIEHDNTGYAIKLD